MKKIIIGASGHGKVVADIAVKNGYNEITDYVHVSVGAHLAGTVYVGQ